MPSESTLRRRLAEWVTMGILTEVWSRLVDLADKLGWIDWSQLIADGTFCPAKKRGIGRHGFKGTGTTRAIKLAPNHADLPNQLKLYQEKKPYRLPSENKAEESKQS